MGLMSSDEPYVRKLFIDYENYDVYEEKPEGLECFEVDEQIAPTISLLNKKGYYTDRGCCQGHDIKEGRDKIVETFDSRSSLDLFPERRKYINAEHGHNILSDNEEGIKSNYILSGHSSYIGFADGVELPSLPKGFQINNNFENLVIGQSVKTFVVQDGVATRRSEEEVAETIKQINLDLIAWAQSLEYSTKKVSKPEPVKRIDLYDEKHLFIDYQNFDVHTSMPEGEELIDWFRCDKLIAETISILNKKGYMTDTNSCEGHMPNITSGYIMDFGKNIGAFISFKQDITIPSFPEGFYAQPRAVGNGFPNCLVSSIKEGLPVIDESITPLPLEDNVDNAGLISKVRSGLPLVDINGGMYFPNESTIETLTNYFETTLSKERETLNTWAKSLPMYEVLGKNR